MSNVLTMEAVPVPQDKKKNKKNELPRSDGLPEPVKHVITFADASGPARVVAHLERELPPGGIPEYLTARKNGARSFVLWAGPHRRERLATLVTLSAADGVATYQVLGAHGELIGTFVREKAFSGKGLRTRWTVTQAGGPETVGYKGRIFWWYAWWLLSPVQGAFIVATALGGGSDVPRGPRRIVWRSGRETPLEFSSFHDAVRLHAPWCDWRLGAALVALLLSFESWLHSPWDDAKT